MITNMDKYKSSGNLVLIPKLEDYIRYTCKRSMRRRIETS